MGFPIKFIDNNLIFNHDNECYAYYELEAYNYNFLSTDGKMTIYDSLRQLFAQSREGKMQLLVIATEKSIEKTQEDSKKHIKGELAEIANKHVDDVTNELVKTYGKNELEYRYYIGFKLLLNEEQKAVTKNTVLTDVKNSWKAFLSSANRTLFDDYTSVDIAEIERYAKVERYLESRITKRFKMRRMEPKDYAYVVQNLYGQQGTDYDTFRYHADVKETTNAKMIKTYDVINLTDSLIEEEQRYLKITNDDMTNYVAYLPISNITGDLEFPDNEILYHQQQQFNFPVDVSINVECMPNVKALTTIRNKKKELKSLDEHAVENDGDSSNNLLIARDDADELEAILEKSKESMYKMSYVVRVVADSEEELQKRVTEVRDYYDDYSIKLQRPHGDMIGLHEEFIPSASAYRKDYIQYVTADFLAGLGFGSTQKLGEDNGIYIGYNVDTGKTVRIQPWLAAQGIKGTVTNALASAFIGSLGGGKSFSNNLVVYYATLFGAKSFIVDPKSERYGWVHDLVFLRDKINIVNLTSEEENKGLLDPYIIMDNRKDAERLAIDTISFLTGITARDGKKFPVLRKHVRTVSAMEKPGMLHIIEELKNSNDDVAMSIADHIESFVDYDFAHLLFSDGTVENSIKLDKPLNVLQIADLVLPDENATLGEYTTIEMLSVAMMIVISSFALKFIQTDRATFKIVDLDEAWTFLQVAQGKTLANKLVRAGRAMNAAVYFVTQNTDDLLDEKMKNNIGMKFAFRSTDINEIEKTFQFYGIEKTDENVDRIKNLDNGECLFQDIWGRTGVVKFDAVFDDLFRAFDTRPPLENEVA
ncbi:ATP-binding protein [Listeria seeligeri]|uniref:conjugal transfer ATPase TcpF n=1 Tax=Listeria seeligeri TaxID=1640 RepID=UPI0018876CA5|nr:ATP-binding protein [Listeria seeligeri]MBF2453177.1 ATP-binding protein [Listeria seeligeri]MBF2523966.1 ATP-binding protein [Listeria seeligeri]